MKILYSGGGTLGPVTPLIAIRNSWLKEDPSVESVWAGTPHGPERELMEVLGIPFYNLPAPKLSRHSPGKWMFIPFQMLCAMWKSYQIIKKERPDVHVTAGGYTSVPLVWVSALMGVPVWVHQQDVRAGLANKLMAPFAKGISVAWERTLRFYSEEKTEHIGNPVRSSILEGSRERALDRFGLDPHNKTVVVFGGGTGSAWLNKAISQIVRELSRHVNILHITGKGKHGFENGKLRGYVALEFVKEGMGDIYAAADVVVCRAGMGTISELAALRKPGIIIPIPSSHQEDNASVLAEHGAAVVLHQEKTTPQMLKETIENLLESPPERNRLGARLNSLLPTDRVAEILVHRIQGLIK